MSRRNPLLDAAIDECRKAGAVYYVQATAKGHTKLYISNSPMIVLIGSSSKIDVHAIHNVRADVRKSLKLISK